MTFSWKPPRKQRPRDQWGQFRSNADIARERQEARFESMAIAVEESYWESQEDEDED